MLVLCAVEIVLISMCMMSVSLLVKGDGCKIWSRFLRHCLLGGCIGAIFGIHSVKIFWSETIVCFLLMGCLVTCVVNMLFLTTKKMWTQKPFLPYYHNDETGKVYITGDKHRDFQKIKSFCRDMHTQKNDVLIILGDSGFNYYEDRRDDELKTEMSAMNITFFCLYGNKEKRPSNISTYGVRNYCGGRVYYEPKYPNIYFAIDGEIYVFEGKRYMVIGGAHSVDKLQCLQDGTPFFSDEMPDDTIRAAVEDALAKNDYTIHGMLTHTCPLKYLPSEMFMSTRQYADVRGRKKHRSLRKVFKPDIDRSTELWLDKIEECVEYAVWYCGHYHVDKSIDKIHMLYEEIRPLHL